MEANKDAKAKNEQLKLILSQAQNEGEALAELTPLLEKGYADKRAQDAEFEKIEPPPEDRDTVEKIRAAANEDTALLGQVAEAARSGDAQRFASLIEEQGRSRTRAEGLAQGYGLRESGSGAGNAVARRHDVHAAGAPGSGT